MTIYRSGQAPLNDTPLYPTIYYEDLDTLPAKINMNHMVAVFFPSHVDSGTLRKIFDKFVPDLKTIISADHRLLNAMNLAQIDEIFNQYNLSVGDLDPNTYTAVINQLDQRIRTKIQQFVAHQGKLTTLLEELAQVKPRTPTHSMIITDALLQDPHLIAAYGRYPDLKTFKDTQINRVIWISRQLDGGQLYYLLASQVWWTQFYQTQLIKIPDPTMTAAQLAVEQEIIAHYPVNTAVVDRLNKIPPDAKVPIYIDSETGLLDQLDQPDRIYVLNGLQYQPLPVYVANQKIKLYQLNQDQIRLHATLRNTHDQFFAKLAQQIREGVEKNHLLSQIRTRIGQRSQVNTLLRLQDMKIPGQVLLIDKETHKQSLIHLIQTEGVLSQDGKSFISKVSHHRICCRHEKAEAFGEPLDDYIINHDLCRYCGMYLRGLLTFDTLETEGDDIIRKEVLQMETEPPQPPRPHQLHSYRRPQPHSHVTPIMRTKSMRVKLLTTSALWNFST